MGYADNLNLYLYVAGDPVNSTDPTGNAGCNSASSRLCSTSLRAQSRALRRIRRALKKLKKIRTELADAIANGGSSSDVSGASAFEAAFGKGTFSLENVDKVIGVAEGAVTFLEDDGANFNFRDPTKAESRKIGPLTRGFVNKNDRTTVALPNEAFLKNDIPDRAGRGDLIGRDAIVGHEALHTVPALNDQYLAPGKKAYGVNGALMLRKQDPTRALNNPDNYVYYLWRN